MRVDKPFLVMMALMFFSVFAPMYLPDGDIALFLTGLGLYIFMPGVLIVAFGPTVVDALRNWHIRRTGVRMLAVVVSAESTGVRINGVPQFKVTVRLQSGETAMLRMLSYGVYSGTELEVFVNPNNPRKATLA